MQAPATPASGSFWRAGATGISPRVLATVAWVTLAFWLYYAFLRQVAGPLNPDEIYFSHTLWLIGQGKRQFVDFYSNHLPTYFQLLRPLVAALSTSPTDLSFLWAVRILSAAIVAMYLTLAWSLSKAANPHGGRTSFLATSALMLVFVVLGRMVEVRSDTIGLLLMNAAWALVFSGRSSRKLAGAALLAGLAILFSARAAGMVGVFGLLMLVLAVRSRDWASVRALLYVAGFFVVAGIIVHVAAPEWIALVIRYCFVEPSRLLGVGMPLYDRVIALDRIPLTAMIVGGLLSGFVLLRRGQAERGFIVAAACGAQLLMVVLDPAPYQYVFGWAAVPAVLGLVSVSLPLALFFPASVAAALLCLSIGYGLAKGEAPPTASYFRLTFDATLSEREIAALPTPDLVALLISDKHQKNLASQLRVRSEVCRRLGGTTLAIYDTHPVCLDDATFYWTALRWPALAEGDRPTQLALPNDAFWQTLLAARPTVIIWSHRWAPPPALLPATKQRLACCYEIHDGFAVLAK